MAEGTDAEITINVVNKGDNTGQKPNFVSVAEAAVIRMNGVLRDITSILKEEGAVNKDQKTLLEPVLAELRASNTTLKSSISELRKKRTPESKNEVRSSFNNLKDQTRDLLDLAEDLKLDFIPKVVSKDRTIEQRSIAQKAIQEAKPKIDAIRKVNPNFGITVNNTEEHAPQLNITGLTPGRKGGSVVPLNSEKPVEISGEIISLNKKGKEEFRTSKITEFQPNVAKTEDTINKILDSALKDAQTGRITGRRLNREHPEDAITVNERIGERTISTNVNREIASTLISLHQLGNEAANTAQALGKIKDLGSSGVIQGIQNRTLINPLTGKETGKSFDPRLVSLLSGGKLSPETVFPTLLKSLQNKQFPEVGNLYKSATGEIDKQKLFKDLTTGLDDPKNAGLKSAYEEINESKRRSALQLIKPESTFVSRGIDQPTIQKNLIGHLFGLGDKDFGKDTPEDFIAKQLSDPTLKLDFIKSTELKSANPQLAKKLIDYMVALGNKKSATARSGQQGGDDEIADILAQGADDDSFNSGISFFGGIDKEKALRGAVSGTLGDISKRISRGFQPGIISGFGVTSRSGVGSRKDKKQNITLPTIESNDEDRLILEDSDLNDFYSGLLNQQKRELVPFSQFQGLIQSNKKSRIQPRVLGSPKTNVPRLEDFTRSSSGLANIDHITGQIKEGITTATGDVVEEITRSGKVVPLQGPGQLLFPTESGTQQLPPVRMPGTFSRPTVSNSQTSDAPATKADVAATGVTVVEKLVTDAEMARIVEDSAKKTATAVKSAVDHAFAQNRHQNAQESTGGRRLGLPAPGETTVPGKGYTHGDYAAAQRLKAQADAEEARMREVDARSREKFRQLQFQNTPAIRGSLPPLPRPPSSDYSGGGRNNFGGGGNFSSGGGFGGGSGGGGTRFTGGFDGNSNNILKSIDARLAVIKDLITTFPAMFKQLNTGLGAIQSAILSSKGTGRASRSSGPDLGDDTAQTTTQRTRRPAATAGGYTVRQAKAMVKELEALSGLLARVDELGKKTGFKLPSEREAEKKKKFKLDYDIPEAGTSAQGRTFTRQRTYFEAAGGVRNVRQGDELDAQLGVRMFESEYKRGKYLSKQVNVDAAIGQLFDNIPDRLQKAIDANDGNPVKPSKIFDFKGLGFNQKESDELDKRYGNPDTVTSIAGSTKAFNKLIDEFRLMLERGINQARKESNAQSIPGSGPTGTGNGNARELNGNKSFLFNQRSAGSGAILGTYAVEFDKYGKTVVKSLSAASDAVNIHTRQVNSAIRRVVLWGTASFAVFGLVNQIQNLVKVTTEVDERMRKFQFLMNSTNTDFGKLGKQAFDVARQFGFGINETLDAMVVFAQQGKTQSETIDLVKSSLLAANQTELNATQATEALTSAMAIFNVEASDSERIVDAWSNVANKSAASADVLANAIKKIGGTANLVGVDFNELNGIIATIQVATRKSGSEIGTALKFIFQSFQKPETIELLESLGIAVFRAEGEMRKLPEILKDVQAKFSELDSSQKLNVLTTIASRRHFADLAVLLKDLSGAQKLAGDSSDSFGVAQKNNEIVMQSFAKQLQIVKTNITEAGTAIGNAGLLQGLTFGAKVVGEFAHAANSIPTVITAGITTIALLALGLHGLGRIIGTIGGQELPNLSLGLKSSAAAQALLRSQTDAETFALIREGNAIDNLSTKLQTLEGGKFAKFLDNPGFVHSVRSNALQDLGGRAESGKLDRTIGAKKAIKPEDVTAEANPYLLNQKRDRLRLAGSIGGFAAGSLLFAASRNIKNSNESGDRKKDIGASLLNAGGFAATGAGLGSLFGNPVVGAGIGATVGGLIGLVDVMSKYSDSIDKQIERSDKFTAKLKSQIEGLKELRDQILKTQSVGTDPLSGNLISQEFPSDKVSITLQKFAEGISNLGKLENVSGLSGKEFKADEFINSILGKNTSQNGLPTTDLASFSDFTSVLDEMEKSLNQVTTASNLNFFAKLEQQMKNLAISTKEYKDTLKDPQSFSKLGFITGGPIGAFLGGKTGFSSIENTKGNINSFFGRDEAAAKNFASARALEKRNVIDQISGTNSGFENNSVAQAAAFADSLDQFNKAFKEGTNRLRLNSGQDLDTRQGNFEGFQKAALAGLSGKEGLLGIDKIDPNNFAAALAEVQKNGSKENVALATGVFKTLSQIQQTIVTGKIDTTAGDIATQRRFNKQEGFVIPDVVKSDNQVDLFKLDQELKAGVQIITKRGKELSSVIIESISPEGIAKVGITSEINGLSNARANVQDLDRSKLEALIRNKISGADEVQVSKPGTTTGQFFSSQIEDIQKELRSIITVTDRVTSVFNKRLSQFGNNLDIVRTLNKSSFSDSTTVNRELGAQNALTSEIAKQIFGTRKIGFSPAETTDIKNPLQQALIESQAAKIDTDKQLVDTNKSLTSSVDRLAEAINKRTSELFERLNPSPLNNIKTLFSDFEKNKDEKSLTKFLNSSSLLNIDKDATLKNFKENPQQTIDSLKKSVQSKISADDLFAENKRPNGLKSIKFGISSGLSDSSIGLLDLFKNLKLAEVTLGEVINKAAQSQTREELLSGRVATGEGAFTKADLEKIASANESLDNGDRIPIQDLKDPEKIRKFFDEIQEKTQKVAEEISNRVKQLSEALGVTLGGALNKLSLNASALDRSKALESVATQVGNLSKLGFGAQAIENLGQFALGGEDQFGRRVKPTQKDISSIAKSLSGGGFAEQVLGTDQKTIETAIQSARKRAEISQVQGAAGSISALLSKASDKEAVFGDTNFLADSTSEFRSQIEKLLPVLGKENDFIKDLVKTYRELEDAKNAQSKFFDSRESRVLKDFTEQQIKSGINGAGLSDQQRSLIKDDPRLFRIAKEGGIIPDLGTDKVDSLRQSLDSFIASISKQSESLAGNIDKFDIQQGTINVNAATINMNAGVGPVPTYHSGKLNADETMARLQKGEAVIPRSLVPSLPYSIVSQLGTDSNGLKTLMGAPTFHSGLSGLSVSGIKGGFENLYKNFDTNYNPTVHNNLYDYFEKALNDKLSKSYMTENEKKAVKKQFYNAWQNNLLSAPSISRELIQGVNTVQSPFNALKANSIDSSKPISINPVLGAFSSDIQQSPRLLGGNYINDIINGYVNYNEFNDMRRKLGLGFGSREDEQIALAIKSAQLKRYHTGGISMEEQVAVLQKDEAIIPKHLVGALPEGILNRIPNGNIEARIGNKSSESVSNNNNVEANIPVNIQMVTNGAGNMSTPEGVRNMIKKELENYNLLGAIMDAPVRMLNK